MPRHIGPLALWESPATVHRSARDHHPRARAMDRTRVAGLPPA